MTKIINTKNNVPKPKRKRIWNKLCLFMGFLTLLTIIIGSYYYLTNKPKIEITTILNSCEKETNELTILEEKITTFQEELKQENLTSEVKTNLEQIIKKQQEKETDLKNFVTFQVYMNHLTKEIQACEKELKENEAKKETSLAKKHHLAEQKLTKEKELLSLKEKQKLFGEKEELNNHVLKHLKEELKNPQLTPDKKTKLEEEKTKIESRITEINQEITKLITKIELKNKIATATEEIETEKDETLKQLLKERKEICQKQLEKLS
ncbi:hypothetical protein [Candidatus Phytoplasma fraxini]|uniref:Uncharacterized protein n=1 Tax=Ash yellows phytoplasma TaxID=35780 RepID=A0ABZ2U7Y7_ASHYP